MNPAWGYFLTNSLWLASDWRKTRAFRRALHNPRATQQSQLFSLLRHNARSVYGRRYDFERLKTIHDYQAAVPVVTYDSLQDEIEAIKQGRRAVLTEEPVIWMEKTAGSTGASKYIPYTASLKREFQAAVAPWMSDLFNQRAKMRFGASYWSITPLAEKREITEGGLPIGCEDERDYFGKVARALLDRLILTPPELARIMDVDCAQYVTLRFLLATPQLSFISVWNPSFLTLLIRFLELNAERLIADLRQGTLTLDSKLPVQLKQRLARRIFPQPRRAAQLETILRHRGRLAPSEIWPKLTLISCWASANARSFVPELQSVFPGVEIQPKGLLATEGVVSIPLLGHVGGAPGLTSHFFEFVPEKSLSSRPLLVDEIEIGGIYQVIITTGGGFYRYDLGDLVEVVGRVAETPLVEFIGKAHHISDLCGEKLHGARVEAVLHEALSQFQLAPAFAMIAPEFGQPPSYVLFLDSPELPQYLFDGLVQTVEAGLLEGHHYSYCRRLGQLGPLRGVCVQNGARSYLERCAALGQRLGSVKPTGLHCHTGWSNWFQHAAENREQDEPLRL
jgi:hypothetical protein